MVVKIMGLFGYLFFRCRILIGIQKGTIILTPTQIKAQSLVRDKASRSQSGYMMISSAQNMEKPPDPPASSILNVFIEKLISGISIVLGAG